MIDPEFQLQLEISMMAACSEGIEPREIGVWGSNSQEALIFVEDFRNELDDDWPGESGYEEYALALARTRLDEIDRSSLSSAWKEIAREAVMVTLFCRTSDLYIYAGLPPAVLLNRLGGRTAGAIWILCESLLLMNPLEARAHIQKWLTEIPVAPGFSHEDETNQGRAGT